MTTDPGVFDRAVVLERLDGDLELFHEIRDLFVAEGPAMVGEVRAAFHGGDVRALERNAHGLKGALLSLAAGPAADVALAIETAARDGELDPVEALVERLDREVDRLVRALGDQETN